jgi:P-type Mg2+ transporter
MPCLTLPRPWHTEDIWRAMFVLGRASPVRLCDVREMWFALHAQSNPMLFQTGSFVESLLSQTLVVHVIRTDRVPFLQSRPSRAVLETTAAI